MKAALEMLIRDYSYETVFRFLRCGLVDFAPETIDYVENYVLAAGNGDIPCGKRSGLRRPEAFRPRFAEA